MIGRCKYCGKTCTTPASMRSHVNACPDVRYFADFVLENSTIEGDKALIGGASTSDVRIRGMVQAAQGCGMRRLMKSTTKRPAAKNGR